MIKEKIINLNNEIESYYSENSEYLLNKLTNKIFSESNFKEVDKLIYYINTPTSTGKNNIIYKLSHSFNHVKYKNIPLLLYIFKECYVLMSNDSDKYTITKHEELYIKDIYFYIMKYKGENDKIKQFRFYLIMINIIWMIDFKGSNIYFLIHTNEHEEFYNLLLYNLINKFLEKIEKSEYLGYTVRIIYSTYIYGDIIEYKFKNFNTSINNIAIYKLLHKIYINNKTTEEDKIKEILIDSIKNDKHISNNYLTENNISDFMNMLKNPYSSGIEIVTYDNNDSDTEESENGNKSNIFGTNNISIIHDIEEVVKILGGDTNNPYFYLLYDIMYNKTNTTILYGVKEFDTIYDEVYKLIKLLLGEHYENNYFIYKITLNNINYIEQEKITKNRKNKLFNEYNTLNNLLEKNKNTTK